MMIDSRYLSMKSLLVDQCRRWYWLGKSLMRISWVQGLFTNAATCQRGGSEIVKWMCNRAGIQILTQ